MCSNLLSPPKINSNIAPTPTDLPDKAPDAIAVKPENTTRKKGNSLRIDLAAGNASGVTPPSGVTV